MKHEYLKWCLNEVDETVVYDTLLAIKGFVRKYLDGKIRLEGEIRLNDLYDTFVCMDNALVTIELGSAGSIIIGIRKGEENKYSIDIMVTRSFYGFICGMSANGKIK